jgi:hypothetical protein
MNIIDFVLNYVSERLEDNKIVINIDKPKLYIDGVPTYKIQEDLNNIIPYEIKERFNLDVRMFIHDDLQSNNLVIELYKQ